MQVRREETMETAALEMRDVVKSFGSGAAEVRAVSGISLTIAAGELVAVRGPSGCGKSTLLHLAGGLEQPTAGSVSVLGRDVSGLSATESATLRRRDVGYVFQALNLVPSLSAIENVMLPLELDGVATREARRQAMDALALVAIEDQVDRYPDDFSGGQRQRIAIARAVVGHRKLLLADEPTGALDTVTGDLVMDLIASLPQRLGTAVVLVTHEPRYAAWADRIVSVRDGLIVDETTAPPLVPMDHAIHSPSVADSSSSGSSSSGSSS